MARRARVAPGGLVYHVLNRAVAKLPLFRKPADFDAFERILQEAQARQPTRILAWCLMRNHWHLVLWPREDGELSGFVRWLSHTHAMRWHVAHGTVGRGHLYHGRFKSFPVQRDEHVLTVCRYVERNACTAGVVKRAETWHYGSLWVRQHGEEAMRALLSDWPVDRPADWVQMVNEPWTDKEQARLAPSLARGRPYGSPAWQEQTVHRLDLQHTVRREGRPSKRQA